MSAQFPPILNHEDKKQNHEDHEERLKRARRKKEDTKFSSVCTNVWKTIVHTLENLHDHSLDPGFELLNVKINQ